MQFETLRILEIIPETSEAFTIKFEAPVDWLHYLPGQYIALKVDIDGESYRRAYSMSSSPVTDDYISVTIKAIPDGRVSSYLKKNLKKGSTLEVMPPMGRFVVHSDSHKKHHYLLIGAGSGITPLMSILKTVLRNEPESQITLLYGNRDEGSIIFKSQLDELENKYSGRFVVEHVLSRPSDQWNGQKGRIEGTNARDLIKLVLEKNTKPISFYVCGPQVMMDDVQQILKILGIADTQVYREYYNAPIGDEDDEISYDIIDREIEFILDGVIRKVMVTSESNILQAIIDLKLDPPYACQEGVCSTCRAKLHSGLVQMYSREGLSDEELEANYILTCQCNPITNDVLIEFA